MTVFERLRATVRPGKGYLYRGCVEEFASLEEYCKWRPALDVLLLEIDSLYILC